MVWFKVDDGWHASRKRAASGLDLEGLAAQGLWAAAGSWVASQLTDGFVPDYMIVTFSPAVSTKIRGKLVERLVRAGLWEAAEQGDVHGWCFHDWKDRNPLRAQVLLEREAAAQRQRNARDKAREARESRDKSRQPSRRDMPVTPPVTHNGSHVNVTSPSRSPRPDPTRPELPSEVQKPVPVPVVPDVTRQDPFEVDKPAPAGSSSSSVPHWRRLRKARCEEHCQPDDKDCPQCRDDHGDEAHNAKRRAQASGA